MNIRGFLLIVLLVGCTQSKMDSLRTEAIPLPPKAQALTRMEDQNAVQEWSFVTTSYTTPDSVQDVRAFYETAFVARGWQPSFVGVGPHPRRSGTLRFGKTAQDESDPSAPAVIRNVAIDIISCSAGTCVTLYDMRARDGLVTDIN